MEETIDNSTEALQKILQWGVEDYICTKQRVEALIRALLEARSDRENLNKELERVVDLQDMVQDLSASCCLIEGRCEHSEARYIHDE